MRGLQTLPPSEAYDSNKPQRNPYYSTMPLSFRACDVKWIKRNYDEFGVKGRNGTQRPDWAVGHCWWRLNLSIRAGWSQQRIHRPTKKRSNGNKRLWTLLNLQQYIIHHHCQPIMRKKVIFLDQWINRQSCGVLKKSQWIIITAEKRKKILQAARQTVLIH